MSVDPGTDWTVTSVVSVTDGDTLRVFRRRRVDSVDGITMIAFDDPVVRPRGVAIRLVTLDTPEKLQVGWLEARRDVEHWIANHPGGLGITTWPDGGFSRYLGDVYNIRDRTDTLSRWMIIERGWPPYVRNE